MHELGIVQGLVQAVSERVGAQARVTELHLRVGRLSGVLPDAMRFCFDVVAAGTPLEGARLDIEEPDGLARCRDCGAEFDVPDLILLCACGSADVDVVAGRELAIASVRLA
jgi:hydrogenase nickel incorporation protein HypA/HybF